MHVCPTRKFPHENVPPVFRPKRPIVLWSLSVKAEPAEVASSVRPSEPALMPPGFPPIPTPAIYSRVGTPPLHPQWKRWFAPETLSSAPICICTPAKSTTQKRCVSFVSFAYTTSVSMYCVPDDSRYSRISYPVTGTMDASSACAADAPQRTAAAISSPLNPPFKNLSFLEVIMAYSFYEFGNILPQVIPVFPIFLTPSHSRLYPTAG